MLGFLQLGSQQGIPNTTNPKTSQRTPTVENILHPRILTCWGSGHGAHFKCPQKAKPTSSRETLGVASPFLSTILLFKNQPFFFWVSGGEGSLERMEMEGTPRKMGSTTVLPSKQVEPRLVVKWSFSFIITLHKSQGFKSPNKMHMNVS